ncbi:MAG: 3-dehydroquinate synthase [Candidatus Omnitrophota bacterium]|jgi:3-dehydroquinate synthase
MRCIKVNLKKYPYNIIVGNQVMKSLGKEINKLKLGKDAYIITNAPVKNKYGRALDKALKQEGFNVRFRVVADTEKSKSIDTVSAVIRDIASFDKKKRIFIIAFGGGVIGDLAGFIASIYKRGIAYVQVPTTLLAQVDSSIGGKTAVDLREGKNLIGTFYQPRLVFSDVSLLKTLDLKQVRSGLAEVIKYAVIKDAGLFAYLKKNYKSVLALDSKALEFIIRRSSYIKAKIVERDEKEAKGIRTILNFGHTIGHALEAAGGYRKYGHGEAIALGMLVASDISLSLGLIRQGVNKKIEDLIKAVGLPAKIEGIALGDIIEAHYYDKKFIGRRNKLVLTSGIGRVKLVDNVPLGIIREAVGKRLAI